MSTSKGKEKMREEVTTDYPMQFENDEDVEFGTESDNEDETARNDKKRTRMEMEPKTNGSTWWDDHSEKLKDVVDVTKAKCAYCGDIIIADSNQRGVSCIKKHIMGCEKAPNKVQGSQAGLGSQTVDQDKVTEALHYMLIVNELPFDTVEKLGFRRFMLAACPDYKIPSPATVAKDIYKAFSCEICTDF